MLELLEAPGLARSSYFYHRAQVRGTMADIFERNHRCYSYRMRASLRSQCVDICEKVVPRLMKQERLVAATPKRRR